MQTPRHQLTLDIDEGALRFSGEVAIDVTDAPDRLVLNSRDLEIEQVHVDGVPRPYALRPDVEELEVGPVPPGDHQIRIRFKGRALEKGLIGLYRSAIPDGYVVASMLFPNGARRVFPCFDQPDRKSIFEATIVADPASQIIFNTPPVRREVVGGRQRVTFAPTPKMSTYLVFLAVGRFAFREGAMDGVTIRVAAAPGREAAGAFALEHAGRALDGFNRYYGIPYPLPKLDLVSLTDFWAGAMENWGAIAHHETRLLVDPTTGVRSRRRVRETVTHEIAHQWFGNLVTMAGWNDFWLNESFAMFMQARLDTELYPELDLWAEFFLAAPVGLRIAYAGDSLRSTHPIEVEVKDPNELGQLADEITYGKGAGILRMVEAYLGTEAFRRGIHGYLTRYAYANARSQDLWGALQEASREPVGRIMERWIRLDGHPVVRVHRSNGELRFSQRPYRFDGSAGESIWPVPLTYSLDGVPGKALFESRELAVPVRGAPHVVVNPDRTGFYRVLYDPALFEEQLARFGELSELDRWGLLMDGYSFLFSGDLSLADYLRIVERSGHHPGTISSGEVVAAFSELLPFSSKLVGFEPAIRAYIAEVERRLPTGPAGEVPEAWAALRASLVVARILLEPEYAAEVARDFERLETVPADRRVATIVAYAVDRPAAAFLLLRDRMFASHVEEESRQMLVGLVSLRPPELVAQVLDLVLDPRMPASRSWTLMNGLTQTRSAPDVVWSWLAAHLPELDRLLAGTPLLSRTLDLAIPTLGVYRPEEVRRYFAEHKFPEASRGVVKGLEKLDVNLAFLRRNGALPT